MARDVILRETFAGSSAIMWTIPAFGRECSINRHGLRLLKQLHNNRLTRISLNCKLRDARAFIRELIDGGWVADNAGQKYPYEFKKVRTRPALDCVILEITRRCNLACKYCYAGATAARLKPDPLSTKKILELIGECNRMGVREICLTGGEVFCREDICEILDASSRLGICSTIFTNGTLLSETIVKQLSKYLIREVRTSLDGFLPATHDAIRGSKGSFKRTMKSIEMLRQSGMPVTANVVATKSNCAELKNLIEMLRGKGIDYNLSGMAPAGRGCRSCADNLSLMKVALMHMNDILYKEGLASNDAFNDYEIERIKKRYLHYIQSGKKRKKYLPTQCGVGKRMIFVSAEGDICLCPTLSSRESKRFCGGNILKDDLKNIWENSPVFRAYRYLQCKDIRNCKYSALCRGGCRSDAYLRFGGVHRCDKTQLKLWRLFLDTN